MKKFTALLMTLVLVLALCSTAFATTITITDSTGRNFNAYKLLALTTSLKTGDDHPADCDGTNHSHTCYNYAYTVNDTYLEVLQAVVAKEVGSADATDAQILDYLTHKTSDSDSGDNFGTLRPVADSIYRKIKEKDIAPDATIIGKPATVEEGYWLIADVSNMNGKNDANSLVMVDTKGQNNITISPKVALPTVEKKVKDINDSKDSSIVDNPWIDSADHDIGDIVPFKLTATLPSNVMYYESYKMVFHDVMSPGLTLSPNFNESIKVGMYADKSAADTDTGMTDVTSSFQIIPGGLTDDCTECTFHVGCDNVLGISGVTKDTVFVVYFDATLNTIANIGSAGNPNEVYLEFSNDPYGTSTGKTEVDKVIVFTYQVTVNKVDPNKNALQGAGFTLYKKNVNGDYVAVGVELKGEAMTTFNWVGLDDGDYKLEETTVPAGYNKMEDIEFTIAATHDEESNDPKLTALDGGEMGTGEVSTGAFTKDIVNRTGTVLPETGAQGTARLIAFSSMAVLFAAVVMITRKKMSIYEN